MDPKILYSLESAIIFFIIASPFMYSLTSPITKLLKMRGISTKLIVDCSHGNSGKSYKNQPLVIESIMSQINHGQENICGVMIESNILERVNNYLQNYTLQ
jgi:phospho-2-dehydro-3-deoxyheptonate aldolase